MALNHIISESMFDKRSELLQFSKMFHPYLLQLWDSRTVLLKNQLIEYCRTYFQLLWSPEHPEHHIFDIFEKVSKIFIPNTYFYLFFKKIKM